MLADHQIVTFLTPPGVHSTLPRTQGLGHRESSWLTVVPPDGFPFWMSSETRREPELKRRVGISHTVQGMGARPTVAQPCQATHHHMHGGSVLCRAHGSRGVWRMLRCSLLVYDTSGCSAQGFSWSPSNRSLNRSKLASTRLCNNHIIIIIVLKLNNMAIFHETT